MYGLKRPDELTPAERLEAVATVFAYGILRLRANRGQLRVFRPEENEESGDAPLEVLGETVLSVHRG